MTKCCRPVGCRPVGLSPSWLSPSWPHTPGSRGAKIITGYEVLLTRNYSKNPRSLNSAVWSTSLAVAWLVSFSRPQPNENDNDDVDKLDADCDCHQNLDDDEPRCQTQTINERYSWVTTKLPRQLVLSERNKAAPEPSIVLRMRFIVITNRGDSKPTNILALLHPNYLHSTTAHMISHVWEDLYRKLISCNKLCRC